MINDWINQWIKTPGQTGQRINGDWEGVTEVDSSPGFDFDKHVKSRDLNRGLSLLLSSGALALTTRQGENREVGVLCAVRTENGACKIVHVAREFKSGAGLMGAREIAAGIKAMVVDVCGPAGISIESILGRLEIYGDSQRRRAGAPGASMTRSWASFGRSASSTRSARRSRCKALVGLRGSDQLFGASRRAHR